MTVQSRWELPGQNVSCGDGFYVNNVQLRRPALPEWAFYGFHLMCHPEDATYPVAAWLSKLNVTYAELTGVNATSTHRFPIWRVCPDSTLRFTLTSHNQVLKSTLPISAH